MNVDDTQEVSLTDLLDLQHRLVGPLALVVLQRGAGTVRVIVAVDNDDAGYRCQYLPCGFWTCMPSEEVIVHGSLAAFAARARSLPAGNPRDTEFKQSECNVCAFYEMMFSDCQPAEAVKLHEDEDYIQHNMHVKSGKQEIRRGYLRSRV